MPPQHERHKKPAGFGRGVVAKTMWLDPATPPLIRRLIQQGARSSQRGPEYRTGCLEKSAIWFQWLEEKGVCVKRVEGTFQGASRFTGKPELVHYWLLLDGHIFDPTAHQFLKFAEEPGIQVEDYHGDVMPRWVANCDEGEPGVTGTRDDYRSLEKRLHDLRPTTYDPFAPPRDKTPHPLPLTSMGLHSALFEMSSVAALARTIAVSFDLIAFAFESLPGLNPPYIERGRPYIPFQEGVPTPELVAPGNDLVANELRRASQYIQNRYKHNEQGLSFPNQTNLLGLASQLSAVLGSSSYDLEEPATFEGMVSQWVDAVTECHRDVMNATTHRSILRWQWAAYDCAWVACHPNLYWLANPSALPSTPTYVQGAPSQHASSYLDDGSATPRFDEEASTTLWSSSGPFWDSFEATLAKWWELVRGALPLRDATSAALRTKGPRPARRGRPTTGSSEDYEALYRRLNQGAAHIFHPDASDCYVRPGILAEYPPPTTVTSRAVEDAVRHLPLDVQRWAALYAAMDVLPVWERWEQEAYGELGTVAYDPERGFEVRPSEVPHCIKTIRAYLEGRASEEELRLARGGARRAGVVASESESHPDVEVAWLASDAVWAASAARRAAAAAAGVDADIETAAALIAADPASAPTWATRMVASPTDPAEATTRETVHAIMHATNAIGLPAQRQLAWLDRWWRRVLCRQPFRQTGGVSGPRHYGEDRSFGRSHPLTPIDVETYSYGKCMWLALALHDRFGWPIVADIDDGPDLAHAFVVHPSGLEVDVCGFQTRCDRFGTRCTSMSREELVRFLAATNDTTEEEIWARYHQERPEAERVAEAIIHNWSRVGERSV